jgi:DNA-binding transcriptional regulator PaaX
MGKSVNKGEYITSLSRISSDLDIPVRQVRTAIKRLKDTGEIDTQTTNKYTKITICNYESYQVEEPRKKAKATRKRQA